MKTIDELNIEQQIMRNERASWATPLNANYPNPNPNQPMRTETELDNAAERQKEIDDRINQVVNQPEKEKPSGMKAYWANMTPEQRSAEQKRRHALSKAKLLAGNDNTKPAKEPPLTCIVNPAYAIDPVSRAKTIYDLRDALRAKLANVEDAIKTLEEFQTIYG